MENFLKVPSELIWFVQWTFGVLVVVKLLTSMLSLLRLPAWRDAVALSSRILAAIGRQIADATRSPIRHPRVEFILMVLHSAISYAQSGMILLLVGSIALAVAFHDLLSPWRYVGILLAITAMMVVMAMAFAEAERSRARAHELRDRW